MTARIRKAAPRELLKYGESLGWYYVRHSSSSHVIVRHPNGAQLTLPGTPGLASRTITNMKAALRRGARQQP